MERSIGNTEGGRKGADLPDKCYSAAGFGSSLKSRWKRYHTLPYVTVIYLPYGMSP